MRDCGVREVVEVGFQWSSLARVVRALLLGSAVCCDFADGTLSLTVECSVGAVACEDRKLSAGGACTAACVEVALVAAWWEMKEEESPPHLFTPSLKRSTTLIRPPSRQLALHCLPSTHSSRTSGSSTVCSNTTVATE